MGTKTHHRVTTAHANLLLIQLGILVCGVYFGFQWWSGVAAVAIFIAMICIPSKPETRQGPSSR